jgi:hypothetical protein
VCCNIKWQILSNPIGDPMHNVSLNLIQRYFSGLFPLCSFFIFYVSASPLSVWLHLSRRVDLIPSMCVTRVSGV